LGASSFEDDLDDCFTEFGAGSECRIPGESFGRAGED
jgi:hypothetical protein